MVTHYERLGVQPDDDRETIWRSYLSAVRAALGGDDSVVELRALEEAWEVLRDPDARAAYDRELVADQDPEPAPDPPTDRPHPPSTHRSRSIRRRGRKPVAFEKPAAARPLRRRLGAVLLWLLACALGGVAAGFTVHLLDERPEPFTDASCVTLTATEAVTVPCDSADADGRISAVVTEPDACGDADGGWLERDDGRIACIELLGGED